MRLRWKDLESDGESWYGLAIDVTPAENSLRRPPLRLETGANGRIQLVQGDTPLLWGTLCQDYAGVHLLKTLACAPSAVPPEAIDSAVIEQITGQPREMRLRHWSRHFATILAHSPHTFFYEGRWLLAGVGPLNRNWEFCGEALQGKQPLQWKLHDVCHALHDDPVTYLDWWYSSGSDLVSLRPTAPTDHGRLKWWRKKAREGALPPVLLWFVGCLDAYVIADGHLRLQAALLENQPPEFLVACSTREEFSPVDEGRQQHIVDSLARSSANPRHKVPSVDQMNAVLVAAFDDRPVLRARSRAWARIPSDAHWIEQVERQLRALNRLDVLTAFAERTAGECPVPAG